MTEEKEEKEMESTEEIAEQELETAEEDAGNFKWYAVRIISGHENKVKAYLDNEIRNEKLEDKIRNVLIPLEKIFEVKGGKKKIKLKNFLPGYILIEAELDDKLRDFVSKTPSIINMVGSKSIKGKRLEPIALKPNEVKRIKSILNEEGDEKKMDIQLNIGDPVKVTSGPFNNFSGNILEINLEKLKVKVMVSIFGRKTPIELEITQIEREK
ncbi:MAG: transcription termination/antitermination protein NusG [Ignavibacteria bacterium]